jgi:hypothetical protein
LATDPAARFEISTSFSRAVNNSAVVVDFDILAKESLPQPDYANLSRRGLGDGGSLRRGRTQWY